MAMRPPPPPPSTANFPAAPLAAITPAPVRPPTVSQRLPPAPPPPAALVMAGRPLAERVPSTCSSLPTFIRSAPPPRELYKKETEYPPCPPPRLGAAGESVESPPATATPAPPKPP